MSLAEREELIRLRSEVSEYEVEFRGLKNQDITIRKLESEFIIYVCTFSYCTLPYALTIYLQSGKIEELEENKEEEIQKELK